MKTLFDNDWQAKKVRVVVWFSLLVCAGALYGGWAIFQTFGLSAADGGVLRPIAERLAFGAFVAGLGLVFAGGMMAFANHYATHLARNKDTVIIETLTPLAMGTKRHNLDISEIGANASCHGRLDIPGTGALSAGLFQRVDAPWITMRVARQRFPFIFDLQAEVIDIGALAVLAEGAVDEWKADRS